MNTYAIILAGGNGERLWPLSTRPNGPSSSFRFSEGSRLSAMRWTVLRGLCRRSA
ncbi:MAG: hypothetical protein J6R18_06905 [Kiritimatiellae bacterium]|nr:hypothetical protein [Kiritimatiellia bacterium]